MFYDIDKMKYETLKKRSQTMKPYRGSGAFPLGYREYSDRHFRPLKDEEGFALYYADRKNVDNILNGHPNAKEYQNTQPFAIVRADNSIEFVRQTGMMSENMMLQNMLGSGVYHSKAHGGTVIKRITYHENGTSSYVMHPMFQGLRINMDTLKAVTPHEFYRKKLIRAEAKSYLEQFQDTKNTGLVMLKAMKAKGINELIEDLNKTSRFDFTKKFYEAVNNKYYLDALMYFFLKEQSYWWELTDERMDRFLRMVSVTVSARFNDFVLRNSNVGFDLVKLENGELFSSCKWGYKIVCNGQEVNRL
jgi:hypothetical protein